MVLPEGYTQQSEGVYVKTDSFGKVTSRLTYQDGELIKSEEIAYKYPGNPTSKKKQYELIIDYGLQKQYYKYYDGAVNPHWTETTNYRSGTSRREEKSSGGFQFTNPEAVKQVQEKRAAQGAMYNVSYGGKEWVSSNPSFEPQAYKQDVAAASQSAAVASALSVKDKNATYVNDSDLNTMAFGKNNLAYNPQMWRYVDIGVPESVGASQVVSSAQKARTSNLFVERMPLIKPTLKERVVSTTAKVNEFASQKLGLEKIKNSKTLMAIGGIERAALGAGAADFFSGTRSEVLEKPVSTAATVALGAGFKTGVSGLKLGTAALALKLPKTAKVVGVSGTVAGLGLTGLYGASVARNIYVSEEPKFKAAGREAASLGAFTLGFKLGTPIAQRFDVKTEFIKAGKELKTSVTGVSKANIESTFQSTVGETGKLQLAGVVEGSTFEGKVQVGKKSYDVLVASKKVMPLNEPTYEIASIGKVAGGGVETYYASSGIGKITAKENLRVEFPSGEKRIGAIIRGQEKEVLGLYGRQLTYWNPDPFKTAVVTKYAGQTIEKLEPSPASSKILYGNAKASFVAAMASARKMVKGDYSQLKMDVDYDVVRTEKAQLEGALGKVKGAGSSNVISSENFKKFFNKPVGEYKTEKVKSSKLKSMLSSKKASTGADSLKTEMKKMEKSLLKDGFEKKAGKRTVSSDVLKASEFAKMRYVSENLKAPKLLLVPLSVGNLKKTSLSVGSKSLLNVESSMRVGVSSDSKLSLTDKKPSVEILPVQVPKLDTRLLPSTRQTPEVKLDLKTRQLLKTRTPNGKLITTIPPIPPIIITPSGLPGGLLFPKGSLEWNFGISGGRKTKKKYASSLFAAGSNIKRKMTLKQMVTEQTTGLTIRPLQK